MYGVTALMTTAIRVSLGGTASTGLITPHAGELGCARQSSSHRLSATASMR
jgi:hypothetical protein